MAIGEGILWSAVSASAPKTRTPITRDAIMEVLKNMFRALRHRNYAVFCAGQLISLIGNWMQAVAFSWLIYRITGSSTQLGAVTFCSQIPILLFASFGGIIADKYPKRTVLLTTQFIFMVLTGLLALLTLTDMVQIWHIYAVAILTGITTSVDVPTRQAFIVQLVEERADLSNAIVLNSSMVNGARLIGPSVAGVLVAMVGEGYCFLLNSASYIAVICSLINITVTGLPVKAESESPLSRLANGFKFIAKNQPVASLMLVVANMSINASAHTVLMPVFAKEVLRGDSSTMGILLAAEGVGALIAALLLANKNTIKGMDTIIAVASSCCGILLLLFSFTHIQWLAYLILIPLGSTISGQLSLSNTLVQYLTPDNMRGRVMAFHSMMFMGLNPVGALIYGALADRITATVAIAISGIVLFLGSLRFVFTLRAFRIRAKRLITLTERCNAALPLDSSNFTPPQP